MKRSVNIFDYAGHICSAMSKGILLTTAANGEVNSMTIGWGKLGIEWGRPIFIAYVRESRHTRNLLDLTKEFTVNIPVGDYDASILGYCGTKSGRTCNKLQDLGLMTEASNVISAPGLREFPLTLECRVIYQQKQDISAIPSALLERYYPTDSTGGRDVHIAYFGEIVDAYLITE